MTAHQWIALIILAAIAVGAALAALDDWAGRKVLPMVAEALNDRGER